VWASALGMRGISRITMVLVLAGAVVGGWSLNYANTLDQPPALFYSDKQWGHITSFPRCCGRRCGETVGCGSGSVRGAAELSPGRFDSPLTTNEAGPDEHRPPHHSGAH
jgi:hypothetical protein